MTHIYLLDNNIYSILKKTPNAIRNFNISIRDTGVIPVADIRLRMTPYTVMEALGLTLSDPEIKVPKQILADGAVATFSHILVEAKKYYKGLITRDDILTRARNEESFASQEGKELVRKIFKPLSSNNFETILAENLAFDLAFKYNYPKELVFDITDKFFVNALFTDVEFIARMSKFRLTKKFWDEHYQKIRNVNPNQLDVIENVNKSMRLKTFKDFLDCDIIHFATIGDYIKGAFQPTIAFTCDDGQTIVNRVMAYKTYIEYLKSNLDDNLHAKFAPTVAKWQSGILVFCNTDGTVKNLIPVSEIHPFQ